MMHTLVNRLIGRRERSLGVSLQYLREIASRSKSALAKIGLLAPLGSHRRHLPKEAWHLARLAATRAEGCGDCVQIVVNLALQDGISRELLRDALSSDLDRLPLDLALTMRFADSISKCSDNDYLRTRLIKIFGQAAFEELALAIASSRFIPTLKRALGQAKVCSFVQVHSPAEKLAA